MQQSEHLRRKWSINKKGKDEGLAVLTRGGISIVVPSTSQMIPLRIKKKKLNKNKWIQG